MDKNAARYGQGLFIHYSDILYGTHLTKINDIYITYDKNWQYEGYIMPNYNYITLGNDTLKVEKIIAYGVNKKSFVVSIRTENERNVFLQFKNQKQVYDFQPKLMNNISSQDYIFWIDLHHKPFYVKFWKLFCFVFFFSIFLFSIIYFFKGLKKYW
jgi:hypothetical protein